LSTTGKEYRLAIRIAGVVDKSLATSLVTTSSSLRRTVSAVNRDFTMLDRGFNTIVGVGRRCFTAVATAAGVAAVAVGAAVTSCTKAATEYEHQMADVTKYVNGLADASGKVSDSLALDKEGKVLNGKTYEENYKGMKDALLSLSTVIPMTAEELTKLSAAAGQSGYGINEILKYDSDGKVKGFLRDTAVMGTAMDISAEQAGDWAAKWEKAFDMTHDEIMVLADQINYLGANSATTAAEIAQAVNDAASLGQIAGMDVSTTAALADAMLATGVRSDKVATSIKRTITNMVKGTSATKAMKAQWEELGFTAEGVAMAMQEDSVGTLTKVFEAIGNLPDYKQVAALSTLFGQWAIEGDAKIVGNMKVFRDALDMVSDPGKYGGSMEREFTIKANTSENIDKMVGNAFQAMKIKVGDSFLPVKKEYSRKLIDFIGDITEKITSFNQFLSGADGLSKWMKNAETEFPTFQRKFRKFAQPVFSGITDAGKWIIKNGSGIISVLVGIGAAMVAYKAASTIVHVVDAIMALGSLNPVTLGIMGVVAAVGLLAGAYAACKQHETALVDDNLAKHFGNIALSMEEIQKVAEYIVGTESLDGVKKALDSFENLDGISAAMQESVSEMDILNWKISIGMELTEDESESYRQAIDDYVKNAQEYALQSQYAVSLNLQYAFADDDSEGQNAAAKINQFYQDQYEELSSLGTKLNDAVTDAFNDGLLDIKETEAIADIQRQMAEIEKSLATGEFDAQLSVLGMEYAGSSLTPDSFLNLKDEIDRQVETASEAYQKSYVKNFAAAQAAYHAGDYLNEEEYRNALDGLQNEYLENVAGLKEKASGFLLDTVMNAYADEIGTGSENILSSIRSSKDRYMAAGDWWNKNMSAEDWANDVWLMYEDAVSDIGLDQVTQDALGQLYNEMSAVREELREEADAYAQAGKEIPETILETLNGFDMIGALSGDRNAVYTLIGQELGESEEYATVIELARSQGAAIPEELTNAMLEAAPQAAAQAQAILGDVQKEFDQGVDFTIPVSYDLVSDYYGPRGKGKRIPGHADGGIVWNRELSWLAEEGPEAVIPLDGSRNAVSMWEKAGELLGMDHALDHYEAGRGGSQITVTYSPKLCFYGDVTSKEDVSEAMDESIDRFERVMERYKREQKRMMF